MEPTIAVLTATSLGLLVGVELSVLAVVNPILLRLADGPALAGMTHGARMLGRIMPFWYVGSLVLLLAFTALTWGGASTAPALAGILLQVVSVLLSVTLLVPRNKEATTWTSEDHPEDWRRRSRTWDRLHRIRVGIIVPAFVLVLVSLTLL
jgi:hypothetical protein